MFLDGAFNLVSMVLITLNASLYAVFKDSMIIQKFINFASMFF